MPSPFPGMDPYLERPSLWPDVHHRLISEIQSTLNPALRPRYVARVELRVYISDEDDRGRKVLMPDLRVEAVARRKGAKRSSPSAGLAVAEPLIIPLLLDEEIKEARVEIRHTKSDSLVTVIEVLSPTNKIRGSYGRKSFMRKRSEILCSDVHWVEIDLLRYGTPSMTNLRAQAADYRVLVSKANEYDKTRCWPISVRQRLPVIGIPLRGRDPDVPLDLGAVLAGAYDHAAYDLTVDYRKRPRPPLKKEDATWADRLLREYGLR